MSNISLNVLPSIRMPMHRVADYILTVGAEQAVIVIGKPGIGKTSMLAKQAEINGDKWRKPGDYFPEDTYCYIMLIAAGLDVQDFGMGMPVLETKTIERFIGALLCPNDPRPKIICIDEFGKVPNILKAPIRNLLLEKAMQGFVLPEGSMVWATTNNPADGLGDVLKGHEGNAMTAIYADNPPLVEWLKWAVPNGLSSMTQTVLRFTPEMFHAYDTHDVKDNPYVFDPAKRQISFVSLRSLWKNDRAHCLKSKRLSREDFFCGVAGTLGEAAARVFMTFRDIESELVHTTDILKDPMGVVLPTNIGARLFGLLNACDHIRTHDDIAKFMQYVQRMNQREFEAIFAFQAQNHKNTKALAVMDPTLCKWMVQSDNIELLRPSI
jgi:hypothetical protein